MRGSVIFPEAAWLIHHSCFFLIFYVNKLSAALLQLKNSCKKKHRQVQKNFEILAFSAKISAAAMAMFREACVSYTISLQSLSTEIETQFRSVCRSYCATHAYDILPWHCYIVDGRFRKQNTVDTYRIPPTTFHSFIHKDLFQK